MSLKDLGLSEVRASQLDELVSRLLPAPGPEEQLAIPSVWRTSHVSSDSFFHNKHGELRGSDAVKRAELLPLLRKLLLTGFTHRRVGTFGSPLLHRPHQSPLREVCSDLRFLPGERAWAGV